jgi:hypothetical protein
MKARAAPLQGQDKSRAGFAAIFLPEAIDTPGESDILSLIVIETQYQ